MKTVLLLAAFLIAPPAWAETITFEPGADTVGWGSWLLPSLHESFYQTNWSNTTQFPSGDYAIYNSGGFSDIRMWLPSSTIEGFWISPFLAHDGWYDPYSVHTFTVEGYDANFILNGSATWELTPGFQYLEPGFTDPVSQLRFYTNANTPQWFLLDDLHLTVIPQVFVASEPVSTNVPESDTLVLCFIGLAMVGWFTHKRRMICQG